jgi:hydrogenase maturation protease
MSRQGNRVLIIGYGNPGRLDDGLGPEFAARMEKLNLEGVTVDSNYQLAVEDAAAIAEHDFVIFADADTAGAEPFHFEAVVPRSHMSFSSHSISADALMAMAEDLLNSRAEAYMLGIRGYEFNQFGERISPKALENLDSALDFMKQALEDCNFGNYVTRNTAENR